MAHASAYSDTELLCPPAQTQAGKHPDAPPARARFATRISRFSPPRLTLTSDTTGELWQLQYLEEETKKPRIPPHAPVTTFPRSSNATGAEAAPQTLRAAGLTARRSSYNPRREEQIPTCSTKCSTQITSLAPAPRLTHPSVGGTKRQPFKASTRRRRGTFKLQKRRGPLRHGPLPAPLPPGDPGLAVPPPAAPGRASGGAAGPPSDAGRRAAPQPQPQPEPAAGPAPPLASPHGTAAPKPGSGRPAGKRGARAAGGPGGPSPARPEPAPAPPPRPGEAHTKGGGGGGRAPHLRREAPVSPLAAGGAAACALRPIPALA